jgi:porphobilinogen synthase
MKDCCHESILSDFPRLRRLRRTDALRGLVRETSLSTTDLIQPLFIVPGSGVRKEISSLPGQFHLSPDQAPREAEVLLELGIKSVLLFGLPPSKDDTGSAACDRNGVVQSALRELKSRFPELLLTVDLCYCEYTSHGHCGVVVDGDVDNDQTLELLNQQALSLAEAGADIVAPSGMMDGMIWSLRNALDSAGHSQVVLMSYAAKYSSAFYGPFRDAVESAPSFGDRRTYQMDPANSDEALREVAADIEQGADIVMVKPALSYLDIIRRVKDTFNVPVAAYNVSGEFAMLKAAAKQGLIDEERGMMEMLTSIKRAGAKIIISYFCKDAARLLNK